MKRLTTHMIAVALTYFCASISASCAADYKPTPLSPRVAVKVAASTTITVFNTAIALDRGYFAEEGLDVELVPIPDIATQLQAVVTDQVHFISSGPDPALFNAIARGVTAKIVSSGFVNRPGDKAAALLIRRDLIDSGQYKSPTDLKGAKFGAPALTSLMFVSKWLSQNGMSLKDVETVMLQAPESVAAFRTKALSAAWMSEPFRTISEKEGLARTVVGAGDLFPNQVVTALIVSPNFAQAQPEATRRFVTAYLRGTRDFYHAFIAKDIDPAPIVRILTERSALKDPNLYAQAQLGNVDVNGSVDPTASWVPYQEFFVERGLTRSMVDISKYVDYSFVNAAIGLLGRE